jgi:hypothetical protein
LQRLAGGKQWSLICLLVSDEEEQFQNVVRQIVFVDRAIVSVKYHQDVRDLISEINSNG